MIRFLRKLISRLRTHGLGYFVLVARTEITQPRFRVTRYVRALISSVLRLTRGSPGANVTWSEDGLQFIYDLAVSPITFDFASYLAAAEIERRLRGLAAIDVVFIMGPKDGVREETAEYEAVVDRESRLWRVRNMLLPILSFLPTVRNIAICGTRRAAEAMIRTDPEYIFPSDYRVYLPRSPDKREIHDHARNGVPIFPMFQARPHARRLVAEFLAREAHGRRPVVITLRNYGYTPARNSRNADWLAFADSLDRKLYATIFIHDAETVMGPRPADFSRHIAFDAASVNLEIRMALYEAAWLNMALMHGPAELCWYSEQARYLLFIPVGTAPVQTEAALLRNGHRIGCDLDFAKPYQRIVWNADEFDSLRREFLAMEAMLEAADKRPFAQLTGADR